MINEPPISSSDGVSPPPSVQDLGPTLHRPMLRDAQTVLLRNTTGIRPDGDGTGRAVSGPHQIGRLLGAGSGPWRQDKSRDAGSARVVHDVVHDKLLAWRAYRVVSAGKFFVPGRPVHQRGGAPRVSDVKSGLQFLRPILLLLSGASFGAENRVHFSARCASADGRRSRRSEPGRCSPRAPSEVRGRPVCSDRHSTPLTCPGR